MRLMEGSGRLGGLLFFLLLDRNSGLVLFHYLNKPGFKEGKLTKRMRSVVMMRRRRVTLTLSILLLHETLDLVHSV